MPATLFALLRACLLSIALTAVAAPAFAASFAESVAKFATDDFSDTEEAVGEIAASGNPLAYPIISALQDERLMFDADTKKVYIKQADGKAIDAATGDVVDAIPDSASAVGLNNRLRRAVYEVSAGLRSVPKEPAPSR